VCQLNRRQCILHKFTQTGICLQFDSSLPGAHSQDETEVDVLATVTNVLVAQQLNNLEKLLEMKILSASHDVDHLVELVGFVLEQ
jgi:hypothetical protein